MLFATLLGLATFHSAPPPQDTSWTVGKPAPHIHLPEISSGEAIDLAQFRGKKVLVAEFASW